MKNLFLFVSLIIFFGSCSTKKEIHYFQDVQDLNDSEIDLHFEPVIESNDILYISIAALDEEVLRPFVRAKGVENNTYNSNPGLTGYLVNTKGMIRFPILGDILVSGMTRMELENELKHRLSEYVTDVVVDVRIMNFKVTVLGEVSNPGVYAINDERITLPEAIGLAGDFTEDGKRNEIVVIREEGGKRKVGKVDFTKSDFFNSPFYYLKQNDVVYIEPSLKGVKKSGFLPDIPSLLSLFTVVLSAVIIITR